MGEGGERGVGRDLALAKLGTSQLMQKDVRVRFSHEQVCEGGKQQFSQSSSSDCTCVCTVCDFHIWEKYRNL